LGGRKISYECVRKKVKNVNIRVRPDGTLSVSAPQTLAYARIEEILTQKQTFILRAIDAAQERIRKKRLTYACEDGARISFLGKEYTLRVSSHGVSRIEGEEIVLALRKTDDPEKRKEALKRFAEKELRAYALDAFERFYPLFAKAAPLPELKLRVMRARWGSCRPKGAVITLNTRLCFYPSELVDYVILHEFTHFLHADHSSAFWSALALNLPDWAERKARLNAEPLAEWI
jgi:predicted metal-dependent hydrolase